jgi:hypothetical protein
MKQTKAAKEPAHENSAAAKDHLVQVRPAANGAAGGICLVATQGRQKAHGRSPHWSASARVRCRMGERAPCSPWHVLMRWNFPARRVRQPSVKNTSSGTSGCVPPVVGSGCGGWRGDGVPVPAPLGARGAADPAAVVALASDSIEAAAGIPASMATSAARITSASWAPWWSGPKDPRRAELS